MAAPRLGDLLVQAGACTRAAVDDALRNQVIFGGRLGTNLLDVGAVREADLARALGRRHGVPTLHGDLRLDGAAVALLKPDVADRYDVVPYVLQDRKLALLVRDPNDLGMLDEVAFVTGRQVHPIVVPEARIWALLRETYGLDRQLRGIELDAEGPPHATPGGAPAASRAAAGPDLMDEGAFDALYARQPSAPPPQSAPPAARAPAAPPEPPEDFILDLTEEVPPEPIAPPAAAPAPWQPADIAAEVMAALRAGPGHVAPARFVPAAPARQAPAPEGSPVGFPEALALLAGVADRHAIAHTVLRYARSRFKRAVLLTIQRGEARGWAGLGEGVDPRAVGRLRLRLDGPGVLSTVVATRAHYLGPLPRTEANVRLLKQLGGGVPANAFLVPILALGRVVNVLYADNAKGGTVDGGDLGELLILGTRIAQSYETLLARAARA